MSAWSRGHAGHWLWQDLLWFRLAEGEELLFGESQRVMPGLVDTIMCGCGGNVYAVAVTSSRIIIQHDKRSPLPPTTFSPWASAPGRLMLPICYGCLRDVDVNTEIHELAT